MSLKKITLEISIRHQFLFFEVYGNVHFFKLVVYQKTRQASKIYVDRYAARNYHLHTFHQLLKMKN